MSDGEYSHINQRVVYFYYLDIYITGSQLRVFQQFIFVYGVKYGACKV